MSEIAWTEETWNPVTGCTKVSPGCDNCYAEKMSHRLAAMGVEKYRGVTKEGVWTGRVRCHAEELARPLKWKKPRMVFACSMSDLFHPDVSNEFIADVFGVVRLCKQHTFQILTKRPFRSFAGNWDTTIQRTPNLWLGVTAENQPCAAKRLRWLLPLQAAVSFVSCEPLLGPIDLSEYGEEIGHESGGPQGWIVDRRPLDWAIFGCESGPNRRRCPLEWVRESVDHCQNNGIKVFIKQLDIDGRVEKDINKFPTDLQIREWPEEP